ncbi:MAG: hypothetical protein UV09_C0047G0009 [Candidatus Gottesmanbacteria bacterium GW2011_GWA2_42_18]|uniref:Uncharacterized protein n=1 Tax=Candidatus Gottesmanbacteria bacterium GW2011_GWA2_42_18 TaxID=1618442 RepID=A0A0G0Z8Y9_9BACT|nr:MAG: hypothetical protein UV09_C0047G0009 [Candidatus Gottesmanbacteria bacterium GW2011_GWA2_42_18]
MLAGARRLKKFLNSTASKLFVPASPETLTEVTLPVPLSQSTLTSEIELYGVPPLAFNSQL